MRFLGENGLFSAGVGERERQRGWGSVAGRGESG